MSQVQTMRAFVQQRLSAAAEEIFELFERTIAEYEDELRQQRRLLDAVLQPQVRIHRTDVQLLSVSKEDPPEQQDGSPSLDQDHPPETPHVKQEQQEVWTSQEREQLPGLKEADIKFTAAPVKSEDEEETPQSSQLHQTLTEQMETEADGPEPAGNFNPHSHLKTEDDDKTSDSSEPETDDSCEWEQTRRPQSGLDPLQNNEVPVSDVGRNTGKTSVSISKSLSVKGHLQKDAVNKTGEKPFRCSVCGKRCLSRSSLRRHMNLHSDSFRCSYCNKKFQSKTHLESHTRRHTGEKPYICSVCGKGFTQSSTLTVHLKVHTEEKPFSCSVCKANFRAKQHLARHVRIHTGEKPFSCSVCGKLFAASSAMITHLRVHTGEKPFSCSVCKARFRIKQHLVRHMRIHTGEKPFSCSVCGKRFAGSSNMRTHLKVHAKNKTFNCSVCNSSFRVQRDLLRDVRVHTGEKLDNCSLCKQHFSLQRSVKPHLAVHKKDQHS